MSWLWIDSIVSFEPNHRLVARKTVHADEEYLADHFPPGKSTGARPVMPAPLLIEGMAQTAGILVGSVNAFREKVILAKVNRATFDIEVSPGQVVQFEALIQRIDEAGASTTGTIARRIPGDDSWTPVGEVSLMFSHLDRSSARVEMPEDNFVFSETFRTLIRDANLAHLVAPSG